MTTMTRPAMRELDSRSAHGVHVRLVWSEEDDRVAVVVDDVRTGEHFVLDVRDGERPLDVFHHPYAYAAMRGVVASDTGAGPV
jgi:hypothetical protein